MTEKLEQIDQLKNQIKKLEEEIEKENIDKQKELESEEVMDKEYLENQKILNDLLGKYLEKASHSKVDSLIHYIIKYYRLNIADTSIDGDYCDENCKGWDGQSNYCDCETYFVFWKERFDLYEYDRKHEIREK